MKRVMHLFHRSLNTAATIFVLSLLICLAAGCSLLELPSTTNQPAQQSHLPNKSQTTVDDMNDQSINEAPANTFEEVATYIRQHGKLPNYYITKKTASELGWIPAEGNLHEIAPGKSIGGDRFGNREGLLPKKEGRIWYEADINFNGGTRNADRIVYSNDGLIYMTTDHYKNFTDITEEGP